MVTTRCGRVCGRVGSTVSRWMGRTTLSLMLTAGAANAQPAAATSTPVAQPALPSTQLPRLMVQAGHDGTLMVRTSVSPNGQLVATADETSIRIWNADVGRLVCVIDTRALRKTRRGGASGDADDALSESYGTSMAWSADSLSLYVPHGPRTLQRQDLPRCARAEVVSITLPTLRRPGRAGADMAAEDDQIEELSTLKDGRVLLRSTQALHALTIAGARAAAMPLALLQQAPVDKPEPTLEDLLTKDGRVRLVEQYLGTLGGMALGAHSADGRVVVLTARAMQFGPLVAPVSAAEPLLFVDGKHLPWAALKGAEASYRGASVAAVSASGRWLALRSGAPGGARISLFDLNARQLVHSAALSAGGGTTVSAGPFSAPLARALALSRAVAGLAFSPDEQHLVLLRGRTEAANGASANGASTNSASTNNAAAHTGLAKNAPVDDPTLELRRLSDFAVARRLPLRGTVVPEADLLGGLVSTSGNALTVSARQDSLVFQNASLLRGPTLATLQWRGGAPALASWAATEGAVFNLAFADDRTLVSLQSLLQGPLLAPPAATAAPAPAAGEPVGFDPAQLLASNNLAAQVHSWSLDSGDARRLWAGRVTGKSGGVMQLDPASGRLLRTHSELASPARLATALVMQSTDAAGAELWRQPLAATDGAPQSAQALAWSSDRRLVAVLAERNQPAPSAGQTGATHSGAAPPAGAPANANPAANPAATATPAAAPAPASAPTAATPAPAPPPKGVARAAALLGNLLGGALGERVRQAVPGAVAPAQAPAPASRAEAPPATATPAPPPGLGVTAGFDFRPDSQRTQRQLLLLDGANGQVLARLDLAHKAVTDDDGVHFIHGQRLLVGQRVFDVQQQGGTWRLAASSTRPLTGKVLGVTPDSGRPIVGGGSPDASLNALVLPPALAKANLAQASRDDRLLAVSLDGAVVVHDTTQGLRRIYAADLQGSEASALALAPGGRHLAVGTAQGAVKLFDLRRATAQTTPLATLLGLSDTRWAVVDAEGRFDTSNLGNNPALHWVMPDEPLQALPFEAAMRTHYTPRLLPQLLDDSVPLKPVPALALANRVAPRVTIDTVDPVPGNPGTVRLQVTVAAQTNAKGQASGAVDLRLFRNGQLVGHAPANDGALPLDAAGRFTQVFDAVRLPEGAAAVNFSAYAFNSDNQRSAVAERSWVPPQPAPARPRRAFVLAVGSNTTSSPAWPRLFYAVNDARLMHQALASALQGTRAFDEVIGVTLESDTNGRADATKARFAAALGRLAGRPDSAGVLAAVPQAERLAAATPSDLVVVSFSGHGYVSNQSGELHLVPSDIAAASDSAAQGLARFDARAISAVELERWLRDVDAGQMALVVDACYSAAAVDEAFKAGPMGSRGLGQLAYDKGARILAATQAADVAMEFSSLRHGLLTFALVEEGLRAGLADLRPRDRRIDLAEWLSFAAQRVPELHAAVAGGQSVAVAGRNWATSRAAARPPVGAASGGAPAPAAAPLPAAAPPRVQKPSLFDYTAPGLAVPVVGLLP